MREPPVSRADALRCPTFWVFCQNSKNLGTRGRGRGYRGSRPAVLEAFEGSEAAQPLERAVNTSQLQRLERESPSPPPLDLPRGCVPTWAWWVGVAGVKTDGDFDDQAELGPASKAHHGLQAVRAR